VTRGEEKGGNSQLTEGWRSRWICGSVDKGLYMIVGKRSKLDPPQPDGPWQAGAGGLRVLLVLPVLLALVLTIILLVLLVLLVLLLLLTP
jgi:hypothetical protein